MFSRGGEFERLHPRLQQVNPGHAAPRDTPTFAMHCFLSLTLETSLSFPPSIESSSLSYDHCVTLPHILSLVVLLFFVLLPASLNPSGRCYHDAATKSVPETCAEHPVTRL